VRRPSEPPNALAAHMEAHAALGAAQATSCRALRHALAWQTVCGTVQVPHARRGTVVLFGILSMVGIWQLNTRTGQSSVHRFRTPAIVAISWSEPPNAHVMLKANGQAMRRNVCSFNALRCKNLPMVTSSAQGTPGTVTVGSRARKVTGGLAPRSESAGLTKNGRARPPSARSWTVEASAPQDSVTSTAHRLHLVRVASSNVCLDMSCRVPRGANASLMVPGAEDRPTASRGGVVSSVVHTEAI
jgi:hypothetical protein